METPSQKLAKIIVDRLTEEAILTVGEATKLVQRFADGKLKPEDWRLPIEKSIPKETKA